MKIVAAILAAGQGTRFGADKTQITLGGKPLWRWSFDVLIKHPEVDEVILIASESNLAELQSAGRAVLGGASRQESSSIALQNCPDADILLVHDAARPFLSNELVSRVIAGVKRSGAAAPAVPVTDTIKEVGTEIRTLDRSKLVAMQTPQGAVTELLTKAQGGSGTDEMSLLEAIGIQPELVEGDPKNIKVTKPEDLSHAQSIAGSGEVRTGFGYDVHRFRTDAARKCILGGVVFEDALALDGHSDADVLLHAITDALLGAITLGDIGQHFPNNDPRWSGEPSTTFLRYAAELVRTEGWEVMNIDSTVIAEAPMIMKKAAEIREVISSAVAITSDRVSVKATTNEGLGSIGRSEGIAAFAIATLRRL